jgi:hypothetical protein
VAEDSPSVLVDAVAVRATMELGREHAGHGFKVARLNQGRSRDSSDAAHIGRRQETEDSSQETGVRRQESGDRRLESGTARPKARKDRTAAFGSGGFAATAASAVTVAITICAFGAVVVVITGIVIPVIAVSGNIRIPAVHNDTQ